VSFILFFSTLGVQCTEGEREGGRVGGREGGRQSGTVNEFIFWCLFLSFIFCFYISGIGMG